MTAIVQQKGSCRKKPEVLAPGGSLSQALWALEGGADAVYAGWKEFSARAGAENLDLDDFSTLLSAARTRGASVYGAFNTLMGNSGLGKILPLLWQLWELGLDGVIIQDLGLLRLLQREGPPLDIHASTQMAIQDASGARLARDLGFRRIVLARELSFEEIRAIRQAVPDLELELFVTGAQCYSASGQCQASQRLCGRSANRGACAQLCRSRLDLDDPAPGLSPEGTWFSMRDLNLLPRVDQLLDAGVDSLKIEGRMKGPLYAWAHSRAWRLRLDNPDWPQDAPQIQEVLSKAASGFARKDSTGFFEDSRGRQLMDTAWAGHRGLNCGQILGIQGDTLTARLAKDLAPKDGILLIQGSLFLKAGVARVESGKAGSAQTAGTKTGQLVRITLGLEDRKAGFTLLSAMESARKSGHEVELWKTSDHSLHLGERPPGGSKGGSSGSTGPRPLRDRRPTYRLAVTTKPGKDGLVLETGLGWMDQGTWVEGGSFTLEQALPLSPRQGPLGLNPVLEKLFAPGGSDAHMVEWQGDAALDDWFCPPGALKELRRIWKDALESSRRAAFGHGQVPADTKPGVGNKPPHPNSAAAPATISRSALNPLHHPLPFLGRLDLEALVQGGTAKDRPGLDSLARVMLGTDNFLALPLDPLSFPPQTDGLAGVLAELSHRHQGQRFLVGLNSLAHVQAFRELPAELRGTVLVPFADWQLNLANQEALEQILAILPELQALSPALEAEPGALQLPMNVAAIHWDEDFDPPLFLSRACFSKESAGQPCPLRTGKMPCRPREFRARQARQEWMILVRDCLSYAWGSSTPRESRSPAMSSGKGAKKDRS